MDHQNVNKTMQTELKTERKCLKMLPRGRDSNKMKLITNTTLHASDSFLESHDKT